jgi:hypothetical protein
MSEVLIPADRIVERERRGNLGNTYWVSRLWHCEKSWYSRTIARKGNPDFNVCDRTGPPAGAPLALLAAMAGGRAAAAIGSVNASAVYPATRLKGA